MLKVTREVRLGTRVELFDLLHGRLSPVVLASRGHGFLVVIFKVVVVGGR